MNPYHLARVHQYSKSHTKTWSEKIASLDAYIFVTPEYNHATSAALKNAIDFLFHEWNNKAAGFVGYGGAGGVPVENLRLVMGEIKIADVQAQVALSIFTDFENFTTFKPHEHHDKSVHLMADEVIAWGGALKALRGTTGKKYPHRPRAFTHKIVHQVYRICSAF
jgi:NAD(P)H-dependent FMN reductase